MTRREKVHLYITLVSACVSAELRPLNPGAARLRAVVLGLNLELGYPDPRGLSIGELLDPPLTELAEELLAPANDNNGR